MNPIRILIVLSCGGFACGQVAFEMTDAEAPSDAAADGVDELDSGAFDGSPPFDGGPAFDGGPTPDVPVDSGADAPSVDAGMDASDAGMSFPTGVVAAFDCETLIGSDTLVDQSGSDNSAVCTDCPTIATVGDSNVCAFDGVGNVLRIARTPSLDPSDGFTISVWAKPVVTASSTIASMPRGATTGNAWELVTRIPDADMIVAYISQDETGGGLLAGPNLIVNEWAHIVATFDGTTKRIYLNGLLSIEEAGRQAWDEMHGVLIGADENSGSLVNYFEGLIDDLYLFNRALDAAEISGLYDATVR